MPKGVAMARSIVAATCVVKATESLVDHDPTAAIGNPRECIFRVVSSHHRGDAIGQKRDEFRSTVSVPAVGASDLPDSKVTAFTARS